MQKLIRRIKRFFKRHPKKKRIAGSTLILKPKDTVSDIANTDLIKDKQDNEGRKKLYQYSKRITNIITAFSLIWITWSYVLCTIIIIRYGNSQSTLESLSTAVCQTILAVLCVYFAKALIETALEEKNRKDITMKKIDIEAQETLQQLTTNQIIVPPSSGNYMETNEDDTDGGGAVG